MSYPFPLLRPTFYSPLLTRLDYDTGRVSSSLFASSTPCTPVYSQSSTLHNYTTLVEDPGETPPVQVRSPDPRSLIVTPALGSCEYPFSFFAKVSDFPSSPDVETREVESAFSEVQRLSSLYLKNLIRFHLFSLGWGRGVMFIKHYKGSGSTLL